MENYEKGQKEKENKQQKEKEDLTQKPVSKQKEIPTSARVTRNSSSKFHAVEILSLLFLRLKFSFIIRKKRNRSFRYADFSRDKRNMWQLCDWHHRQEKINYQTSKYHSRSITQQGLIHHINKSSSTACYISGLILRPSCLPFLFFFSGQDSLGKD